MARGLLPARTQPQGGGGWHKASVSDCLPLAAPIGLSPLLILTLRGPERVLVVSTEPLDDLSCLTTPGVGCPGDGAVARAVDQGHPDAHKGGVGTPLRTPEWLHGTMCLVGARGARDFVFGPLVRGWTVVITACVCTQNAQIFQGNSKRLHTPRGHTLAGGSSHGPGHGGQTGDLGARSWHESWA